MPLKEYFPDFYMNVYSGNRPMDTQRQSPFCGAASWAAGQKPGVETG